MTTYINAALRREVIERAGNCCEYCKIYQSYRMFSYEIDHVIAEKHGGLTTSDNLCCSCYLCNGYKGSDIGSIDWEGSGKIAALFNPREQNWAEHFEVDKTTVFLRGLTPEGRVTVSLLRLNHDEHLKTRKLVIALDEFPCE